MKRWLSCLLILGMGVGCDIISPEHPDVTISLTSDRTFSATYQFRVEIDGDVHTVRADPGTSPASLTTQAPRLGRLNVTASLYDGSGTLLAAVTFPQEYEKENNHWVNGFVAARLLDRFCTGDVHAALINRVINPGRVDSLFVMAGRLPKGAIC